ncbi:hypothetical protein [Priestia aryabhattai]|uniref:hypothetical protein n=1 Tax=Priestia aryabhattai TaxID=412384 RepID=UPI002E1C8CF5|nr:hypothetical protein [Priestia aryabhattai]
MDFYSINDYCSKKCRCHELEKEIVKKKIKTYKEADTESKLAMKKDAMRSNDGSIQLYEDEQKFTRKAPKIE